MSGPRVALATIVLGSVLLAGGGGAAGAGSTVLDAVPAETAEANVTSGTTRWRNQSLYFQARFPERDAGTVYQVRAVVDGEVGPLETEFVLNERGAAVLHTADIPPGRYVIVDDTGTPLRVGPDGESLGPASVANASWELVGQTLSATADPRRVVQNRTTTLRLDSNRGRYRVYVSSPDAAADTLAALFGGRPVDTNGDGQSDAVEVSARAQWTRTVRAPVDLPPGRYRLHFVVLDTEVIASATVRIRERPRVAARFGTLAIQEERGDIVSFEVRLNRTRTATVRIGSREVGYLARLRVVDGDTDGVVTVRMNTYEAGRQPRSGAGTIFGTAARPDRVTNVTRVTERRSAPLAAGEYPLTATVGGRRTGAATLVLTNRTPPGATTLVAPEDAATDTLATLTDVATKRRVVALGDKVVIRVTATGIAGFFDESYDLSRGSVDARTHGLYLSIRRRNASGATARLNVSAADLLVAPGAGTFYVVLDTGRADVAADRTYEVRLVETAASPFRDGPSGTVANTSFTVVERRASFERDRRAGDAIVVSPTIGAQPFIRLSGTTTAAPGTELLVTLRSDGEPFIFKNDTVTVDKDGDWSALLRFEQSLEPGIRFTAKVRHGGRIISDRVAVVVNRSTPIPQTTDAPVRESGSGLDVLLFLGALVAIGAVIGYLYWGNE